MPPTSAQPQPQPQPELAETERQMTATIRGVIAVDELAAFFDQSFSQLNEVLSDQGIETCSPAFGLYHRQPDETADLEVGFVTSRAVRPAGDVENGTLPGGRVARLVHEGSFDGLGASWERLSAWIDEQGLAPGEVFWEVYLTGPSPEMDPAELRTELNFPIAE